MAPVTHYSYDDDDSDVLFELLRSIGAWFLTVAKDANEETAHHPYFISIALIVVFVWPHILTLPVWFGRDAFRRIENQTRYAYNSMTGHVPRQRKRDYFITKYRAVVNTNADGTPAGEGSGSALFGGTPLSNGDFAFEEEGSLPIVLRVIRWAALAWAIFILAREWDRMISTWN